MVWGEHDANFKQLNSQVGGDAGFGGSAMWLGIGGSGGVGGQRCGGKGQG